MWYQNRKSSTTDCKIMVNYFDLTLTGITTGSNIHHVTNFIYGTTCKSLRNKSNYKISFHVILKGTHNYILSYAGIRCQSK